MPPGIGPKVWHGLCLLGIARHIRAMLRGEYTDPESNLPHIGHVLCNIVMLLVYIETFPEGDDRPPPAF